MCSNILFVVPKNSWDSIVFKVADSCLKFTIKGWFDTGVTCVGMGSKLISKEILANQDFYKLEHDCRKALEIIKSVRK